MRIFTDGACSGNPGPGGWACVLEPENEGGSVEFYRTGTSQHTTNNQMELEAVINAISIVNALSKSYPDVFDYHIVSDSNYAIKGATKEWKVKTNLNQWEVFNWYMKKAKHLNLNIHFEWVKGHKGNKLNELCDELAKMRIKTFIKNTI